MYDEAVTLAFPQMQASVDLGEGIFQRELIEKRQ